MERARRPRKGVDCAGVKGSIPCWGKKKSGVVLVKGGAGRVALRPRRAPNSAERKERERNHDDTLPRRHEGEKREETSFVTVQKLIGSDRAGKNNNVGGEGGV